MEEGSSVDLVAVPFVLKTYRMVNDPATDHVIGWGRENNSFLVADPFAFSQTLLPSHFKHNNFSSFVRQLNTYGFRKVDPDRWEFAHALFLRGQTHLLCQILRRNSGNTKSGGESKKEEEEGEGEEEERVALEVVKLKQEQRETEDKVERMWRRLRETERRPKQMLAFLVRVVRDPHLLGRLMERSEEGESKKRARLRLEGDGREEMMGVEWDEGSYPSPLDCVELVGDGEGDIFGEDVVDPFVPTDDSVGLYGGSGCAFGGVGMDWVVKAEGEVAHALIL